MAKKEIVKMITEMSGKYSAYQVFSDWVECMALAIQNCCSVFHDEVWATREKTYMKIMEKYSPKERENFSKMYALLVMAFENDMSDFLGEIYMESGCGNKYTGQFFTPFHLGYLTAELGIDLSSISEDNKLEVNEPSTGGGGMIIAAAKVLKNAGINYQKCMKVVAQDLDFKAVYMTYVQLSLLGIDAVVVQGDTLKDPDWTKRPAECRFYTPKRMGCLF